MSGRKRDVSRKPRYPRNALTLNRHARVLDALAHLYAARGQVEALLREPTPDTWTGIYATKVEARLRDVSMTLRDLDDALEKLTRLEMRSRR